MTRYKLAQHVRRLSDEDGAVLLDLQSGRYYSLNRIGDRICDALSEGMDEGDIVAFVRRTCEDVPDTVQSEIEYFLERLQASSLLCADIEL